MTFDSRFSKFAPETTDPKLAYNIIAIEYAKEITISMFACLSMATGFSYKINTPRFDREKLILS